MKKAVFGVMGVALLAPLAVFAQTILPSQDSYVIPGNPSNFGTATSLYVGSASSQGVVQFDLTTLPPLLTSAQVQQATLTLFCEPRGCARDGKHLRREWSVDRIGRERQ
jgi:hypothetical protein